MDHICGTCKYHINVDGEWICLNENSFNTYGMLVDSTDGCDEYKDKE